VCGWFFHRLRGDEQSDGDSKDFEEFHEVIAKRNG
jgi:hypothetical protein